METLDRLSFEDALLLGIACATATPPIPLSIVGPPGIGKSSLRHAIGKATDLEVLAPVPCQTLNEDDSAIPTIPIAVAGKITRISRTPVGIFADACDRPCVLTLDEINDARVTVQGSVQSIALDRRIGDSNLHERTFIILTGNGSDTATVGNGLAMAFQGRVVQIGLAPRADESARWLSNLGEGSDPVLHAIATDWYLTWSVAPSMLTIDPPPASITSEPAPYGAPRNWERALRLLARWTEQGLADTHPAIVAGMTGCVGRESALAYISIRKIRQNLPSVAEIRADPMGAKLPSDLASAIGSLSIVALASKDADCSAAWAYAGRVTQPELRICLYRILLPSYARLAGGKGAHKASAVKAHASLSVAGAKASQGRI